MAEQEMTLLKSANFIRVSRLIIAECLHSPNVTEQTMAQIGESESGFMIWLKQACEDKRLAISDIDIVATQFSSLLKSFAYWPQVVGYGKNTNIKAKHHIVDSAVLIFLSHYQI